MNACALARADKSGAACACNWLATGPNGKAAVEAHIASGEGNRFVMVKASDPKTDVVCHAVDGGSDTWAECFCGSIFTGANSLARRDAHVASGEGNRLAALFAKAGV